ncbi:PRC-barrel domain-containing protein [Autumnicola psychrophila]|uniref:PRC-barrel domain-containing protein n=1 Tax=Autumnicola psychrophila TaxID=3075592 RepID=A0ABU3DV44_9FLAO|nr:PRC-barrel domain-containing protein [Zunongwangia sp. F225]MDT0687579.1 PRC-barrel domain-containing protein [Zunongwangia sp. F225]
MANTSNNRDNKNKHLFYLNELSDYKVASDDPDVRGWEVQDKDNRVVGKVDNLMVNKNTQRVVYLDVEVDKSIIEANHKPYRDSANDGVHEFINKDGENHLIVPVGLVRLNTNKNFVYTDRIDHRTFAQTKRMEKGSNVDRDYETVVLASYDRSGSRTSESGNVVRDTNTEVDDLSNRKADTRTGNSGNLTENRSTGVADNQNDPAFKESRGHKADSLSDTHTRDKDLKGTTSNTVTGKESDPAFQDDQKRRSDNDLISNDDDSFYKRKEFDRTNYKSNKN